MKLEGNRKFVIALLSLTMSFVLAITGNLTTVWVAGLTAINGLFGAANFGEHIAEKRIKPEP